MSPGRSLTLLFALCSLARAASSSSDKQYFDDTSAAWTYTPQDGWGAISAQDPCTACVSQPNATKAYQQTWHDLSKGGSAQLTFTGSGVSIYAICPAGVYRSNFTFYVDNEPAGSFLAPEGGCNDYVYNQLIFHKAAMNVGQHIVQVSNWIAAGAEYSTSDLLLDYAIVTTGNSGSGSGSNGSTQTSSSTQSTSSTSTTTTKAIQPSSTSSSSTSTTTSSTSTTIDDADSAWTYTGNWGAISAAAPCSACQSQPNPSKAHATTWHDLSSAGSAQLLFSGNALSVYAICPGPLSGGGAFSSDFAFTLDGKDNGTFKGDPAGCSSYEYNQQVYTISGLEQGTHNFTISNVVVSSGNTSDLLLDYAVIEGGTVSGSPSTTASSQGSGATDTTGDAQRLAASAGFAALALGWLVAAAL